MGGKSFFVLEVSAAKIGFRGGRLSKYIMFWGGWGEFAHASIFFGINNTLWAMNSVCPEDGGSREKYVWRAEGVQKKICPQGGVS